MAQEQQTIKPKRGQRKTQDPCPVCLLHRKLCLCHLIPRIQVRTKVCLIVHHQEMKRTTNTGRLALHCLVNSEMRIRGRTTEALDLRDLLVREYRTLLFYPAQNAIPLTIEFVQEDPRPVQLLVPDGNWRQASKVHYRHHELSEIPRVMLTGENPSTLHLRAEHFPEGMATLQAVAYAMGIIEGPLVQDQLLSLYQEKLTRTLIGRGKLKNPV